MERGKRIVIAVERLVTFAGALRLPSTDRTAHGEPGNDLLGGQLPEIARVEILREMDAAGTGLRDLQAREQGVLPGIYANEEDRQA